MRTQKRYLRRGLWFLGSWAAVAIVLAIIHFPSRIDPVAAARFSDSAKRFYDEAYAPPRVGQKPQYFAAQRVETDDPAITRDLRKFVERYHLKDKRVLEVGAGNGTFQDLVADYTGLDISSSARRYFHKPFVQGSATDLPFRENEFDAIWTIFVLEHVVNPEQALDQMRRVLKNGGYLFLSPAWFCNSWAAGGYAWRPYSDFGITGRFIKATVPIRGSMPYNALHRIPTRVVRLLSARLQGKPTSFRYNLITPNYQHYWGPDSDALNSMDLYEAILWFTSRGDKCLNCVGTVHQILRQWGYPLVFQIQKPKPIAAGPSQRTSSG